jgi:hypothetical protein
MIWLVVLMYLIVVGLGVVCLWVSFQVGTRNRLSFIRGSDHKPLLQAELIANGFTAMTASLGVVVLLFAIAIPVYSIQWGTWQFYLMVITGIWGVWRQILLTRHAKLLSLTRQRTETPTSLPPLP